ncbi:MAG: cupin domain-containing protein [Gaiellaceae bacterium]
MPEEAPLVDGGAGLVPQGDGWFVVNAADAGWMAHDTFGARCNFEADGRLANQRPDLHVQQHPQLGVRLHVLTPGQPSTMYHRESNQEDFLVVSGDCLLIVEGEERCLHAWDLVHCPAGTTHAFVGAGDGTCVILMVGARTDEGTILYPREETALRHRAGVEEDTEHPRVAYSPFGHWRVGRPDVWDDLPWSG